jgi:phosphatidylethanolamine-binding protein (PEBP) family uncharacterized protein
MDEKKITQDAFFFDLNIPPWNVSYQPTTIKDFFGKNLSTECTIQSRSSFGNKFPAYNVPCPPVKRFLWKKSLPP